MIIKNFFVLAAFAFCVTQSYAAVVWHTSADNVLVSQGVIQKDFQYFHSKNDGGAIQYIDTGAGSDITKVYPIAIYAKVVGSSGFTVAPVYVAPGYEASDLTLPLPVYGSGATDEGLRVYYFSPSPDPISFSVRKQDGASWNPFLITYTGSMDSMLNRTSRMVDITNTSLPDLDGSSVKPIGEPTGLVINTKDGIVTTIKGALNVYESIFDLNSPELPFTAPPTFATYSVNPINQSGTKYWNLQGWIVYASEKPMTSQEIPSLKKQIKKIKTVRKGN